MKIRALIVDDEPLARERIRALLEAEPDIEIAGEAVNGRKAVEAIQKLKPALVFLDIQMPGLDGFQVIDAVGPVRMPAVIFITAYDQHAIKAFEVNALDYLLKPFDDDRFAAALRRARKDLSGAGGGRPERLVIKSSGRITLLKSDEVDWIEATGNYVSLHAGAATHLMRETLAGLEAKLDPARFCRIHRSTIVNLDRIKELQPYFHGDYVLILKDGTRLTLKRGYRDTLRRLLGDPV